MVLCSSEALAVYAPDFMTPMPCSIVGGFEAPRDSRAGGEQHRRSRQVGRNPHESLTVFDGFRGRQTSSCLEQRVSCHYEGIQRHQRSPRRRGRDRGWG